MCASNNQTSESEYKRAERINGCFTNNFNPEFRKPTFGTVMKWVVTEKNNSNVPSQAELNRILPVHKHKKDEIFIEQEGLHFIWIGHASCLVQMDDFVFLTDPVFSERCGITTWVGPKRFRPAALQVEDLPDRLNAVLISHNHFDHLDYPTVVALNQRYGPQLIWYCGEGNRDFLISSGVQNVVEMNWWDDRNHSTKQHVQISFCPAQHWSRRGAFDENTTLWGGFIVTNKKYRFYFAGDTGYTHEIEIFKKIGKRYGPFDLCAIPIGAYAPRWMMEAQHVSPEEAVQIHIDVQSKKSIGIHWGTWALANEYYLEPKTKLAECSKKRNLAENDFVTVEHGQIIDLPEND